MTDSFSDITATPASCTLTAAPVTIVQGDDYSATQSRAFTWTDSDGVWPVLSGATIAMTIKPRNSSSAPITAAGTVTAPTGTKAVTVPLTAAQTSSLPAGLQGCDYAVVATLASGDVVTLVLGTIDVYA